MMMIVSKNSHAKFPAIRTMPMKEHKIGESANMGSAMKGNCDFLDLEYKTHPCQSQQVGGPASTELVQDVEEWVGSWGVASIVQWIQASKHKNVNSLETVQGCA
jgi:hypothetical protein